MCTSVKSLMSLKYPEMLELSVKRVTVLSTDINNSVDVKRHINLRTIAKLKVHAKFDLATVSSKSAATHQHSFRFSLILIYTNF